MADYEVIGAAIAARFATVVVPAGEDSLTLCTDDPPDQLGTGPAVVVFQPSEDSIEWGVNRTYNSVQHWPVTFFRTQGPDLPARTAALAKWRTAFLIVVVNRIQLGLDYVDWAQLRSIDPGEGLYAESKFDILDMMVDVKIREVIPTAAA